MFTRLIVSDGCEHKKRLEHKKRWRITRADIRPGVYGPLLGVCMTHTIALPS